MQQFFKKLTIETHGQQLIEISNDITSLVKESNIVQGIVNLSILHTSASLLIQENASHDVLTDLLNFFDGIAPMDTALYKHNAEGKDDMPAHIKSALTNTQLTLSIQDQQLTLGTWQGIFLFEHRLQAHSRKVLVHILG